MSPPPSLSRTQTYTNWVLYSQGSNSRWIECWCCARDADCTGPDRILVTLQRGVWCGRLAVALALLNCEGEIACGHDFDGHVSNPIGSPRSRPSLASLSEQITCSSKGYNVTVAFLLRLNNKHSWDSWTNTKCIWGRVFMCVLCVCVCKWNSTFCAM